MVVLEEEVMAVQPKNNRLIKTAKLISITGGAQIIVQAIGLISGILVIRLLPIKEYAFYTIANTLLGTMTLLADGGISTAVLSQGAKVWDDKFKLGRVIATGLKLRKKFAVGSLLVAIPILVYLLHRSGSTFLMCLFIVMSLIPAFYADLSDKLLEIAPKLRQDIPKLQKNEVITNIGRLITLTIFLFIFPWTYIALLASGIPRILGNIRLKKISSDYISLTETADISVEKEILKVVKRILPGAIYFCFSGQITIWLVSVIGSSASIATVGALGRITMLIGIFSSMFSTLVSPRFAKLPDNKSILISKFIQVQIGLLSLSLVIIAGVWLFANQLLWVLGNQYKNMHYEILLNMIGGCLVLIGSCSFSMYTNRGWVMKPVVAIPLEIGGIIVALSVVNISTIAGVFLFNIVIAALQVLVHTIFLIIKITSIK